jgi:hypothetical protein
MSAVARAHLLRDDRLPELRAAIRPQKRFLRAPVDRFETVLSELGRELPDFPLSGYVVGVVLPFLDEQHIQLTPAPALAALAQEISDARSVAAFFLTPEHREHYLSALDSERFEPATLRRYYEEFNECQEPEAGEWMLAGISYIRSVLNSIQPAEVALLQLG